MKTQIVIQPEIFDPSIFEVVVSPPAGSVGHDAEFRCLKEAREYARRLSNATGWQVTDLTVDVEV
jgi:hypothetical protein